MGQRDVDGVESEISKGIGIVQPPPLLMKAVKILPKQNQKCKLVQIVVCCSND